MTDKEIEKAAEKYAVQKTETFISPTFADLRHRRVVERFDSYDIEQAYEDGAKAALASQWVSVEDRLPEKSQRIFIREELDDWATKARVILFDSILYEEYADHIIGFENSIRTHEQSHKGEKLKVTHWMPIPKLPEV